LAGWWILAKLSFLQKKNFGGFWGIVRSLRNRTNVWEDQPEGTENL